MADDNLSAFLDSGPKAEAPAPAQETAKAVEAPVAAAPAEKTGEATSAVPAQVQQGQVEDEDGNIGPIPYKRFKAVNEERQELRRQLAERDGRLSVLDRSQQQTAQPQTQTPVQPLEDRWFTDGPGLHRETHGRIDGLERRLAYHDSEAAVRAEVADFDAKRQAFAGALAQEEANFSAAQARGQAMDRPLLRGLGMSQDPGRYVYETGTAIAEWGGVKSPAEYREKVRKEIESEVEQRVRRELSVANAANASTTNAGARGSGATTAPVLRETSDKEIFRGAMR